jgi:hypothetical protein
MFGTPGVLMEWKDQFKTSARIMIIGHNIDFARLLGWIWKI